MQPTSVQNQFQTWNQLCTLNIKVSIGIVSFYVIIFIAQS